MGMPDIDMLAMTVEERLALIEILWDSLTEDDIPLTAAQQEELQRRLADIEVNPHAQMSWEEAHAVIRAQPTKPGPGA